MPLELVSKGALRSALKDLHAEDCIVEAYVSALSTGNGKVLCQCPKCNPSGEAVLARLLQTLPGWISERTGRRHKADSKCLVYGVEALIAELYRADEQAGKYNCKNLLLSTYALYKCPGNASSFSSYQGSKLSCPVQR